ncbi:MAG: aminomethyl-transferring glycine dehydrogenase subunit GcvPB [Chloroflexi bacterium]|nr:aminomethyl-transferring glycine dehydrogenase subunit GcvPB [Chloroflexota bacterium]
MRWNEPLIMEMGTKGERGVLPPQLEEGIKSVVGDPMAKVPAGMRRKEPPKLPEISQPHVLRHYMRLSQEVMGCDVNIDLGLGTCTMKYSPKVNEQLVRLPGMSDIHPLEDEEAVQGMLEIIYNFGQIIKEVSGMDAFVFQGGGGAQGVFTNASIIRAYHKSRGEAEKRNEVITTIFSHPVNAATPHVSGYKIITLYPDPSGYPDLDALKAALSEHTAGLMMTNPEDTGIYNPRVREYTDAVHSVGGVCAYDQANANGVLGIARAREAGFDLAQFNLHKTFSSPHGGMGPGCSAVAVRQEFARFLPLPTVQFDGKKYYLDYDMPDSIGKVRAFLGNMQVVLRSYAWAMSLGPEGILRAARTAVLNNNYLASKLLKVRGVSAPYAEGKYRLQEVRYSWENLKKETGIGTEDVDNRVVDFGVNSYFTSHEPWIVPEPFTLEPTESYSKADLDEYAAIIERVSSEAYSNPEVIKSAPHNSSIPKMDEALLHDVKNIATTWRAWVKKGL